MAKLSPILTCTVAACAALQAADSRNISKTVQLNLTGSVRLETHRGSIHISTWDRPEVEVDARIEAGPWTSRRRFDGTDVAIDSSANSVSIRTRHPCCISDDGSNPLVDYTIRMPRTARLSIRDHASDAHIYDLSAGLDIETHRGTVRVERLTGALQARTHRGVFHVDFAALTGNSLVETHRGSVELALPRESKFDIRADLDRRSLLESDFPVMARLAHGRGRNLEGSVNGGGPILQLNTDRGHIRLRVR